MYFLLIRHVYLYFSVNGIRQIGHTSYYVRFPNIPMRQIVLTVIYYQYSNWDYI